MNLLDFGKRLWARVALVARFKPFATSSPEGRSMERHRRILLNTSSNFLARGFSLAVNLFIIRLVLERLGKEEYGLWVAITAFVMWTTLLDFGILNGLVNAISEAYGREDRDAVITYVSTAFFSLVLVAAGLGIALGLAAGHVDWSAIFSARGVVDSGKLRWSVIAALAPLIVGIPFSIVRQIYASFQKTYVSNIFLMLAALLTLAAVNVSLALGAGLPWLVLAAGVGAPLMSLLNLGYLLALDMPWLKPRMRRISMAGMRRLLKSSTPLFLFQLGALLVNYSQPLLLAYLTSYAVVADYSLLLRLFGLLSSIIVLSTSSFFPAFREAYERGDRDWVRKNFFRLAAIRLVLAGSLGLALVIAGNAVLRAWLGNDAVSFLWRIWLLLAILLIGSSWGTAFSDLLTIMDRIWIQVGFVLFNGVAVVVLTLWLAPSTGVQGALLALGFAPSLVWSWAGPLFSKSILSRDAGSLPAA